MSQTSNTITSNTTTNKAACVFIDHTNVFIQGKNSVPFIKKASDIDYPKLLKKVLGGRRTAKKPIIVGSYRPQSSQDYPKPDDPFWKNLETNGFTVKLYENKNHHREKLVDSEIITRICESVFGGTGGGTIILIAGDGDYEPPLLAAKERGWNVEIWFWKNGLAHSLKRLATEVRYLKQKDVMPPTPRPRRPPVERGYENKRKKKLPRKQKDIRENGGPTISDVQPTADIQQIIDGIPPPSTYNGNGQGEPTQEEQLASIVLGTGNMNII